MTRRHTVVLGDTAVEYEVKRSRRRKKTYAISVFGGIVHIAAPQRAKLRDMDALVIKHGAWILKRISQPTPQQVEKQFESGETFPYLGRSVKLVVESAAVRGTQVRFEHWQLQVTVPRRLEGEKRRKAVRRVVVGWYRSRAAERIAKVLEQWWPRLGRGQKSPVLIRDTRRQWGSCASDGTLRFSWRLMMTKPELVEYVVVHELSHLTHRNHSADFWGLVASVMPDAQQRRKRLDELTPMLPII